MALRVRPVVALLFTIAIAAPWATYLQLAHFLTVVTTMVILLIILIVGLVAFGRKIPKDDVLIFMFIYLFLIFASITWTLSVSAWAYYAYWWFLCSIVYLASSCFLTDEASLRHISVGSAIGVLFTAFFIESSTALNLVDNGRYAVPGHNSNFTGYVLAGMVYIFFLVLLVARPKRLLRMTLYAASLGSFVLMYLLGTRGAQLSSFLVVVFALLSPILSKHMMRLFGILLLLVAFGFTFGLIQSVLLLIDAASGRSTGDLSGRLVIWAEAISNISEHIWLGIGPGTFAEISRVGVGAHNLFLTILLDTGVVGMVVFCGLFYAFYKSVTSGTGKQGSILFLMFSCYWVPIVTSGHWELSPYSWITVGATVSAARIIRRRSMVEAAPQVVI